MQDVSRGTVRLARSALLAYVSRGTLAEEFWLRIACSTWNIPCQNVTASYSSYCLATEALPGRFTSFRGPELGNLPSSPDIVRNIFLVFRPFYYPKSSR